MIYCQEGRPFTVFATKGIDPSDPDPTCAPKCTRSDPSGQGLKDTYVNYDGSSLHYDFHNPKQFFNTGAFSLPQVGTVGNAGRNSVLP